METHGARTRIEFDPLVARRSIFQALVQARDEFGGASPALVDGDERSLSYDDLIRASFALGHALRQGTRPGDCVGVMLPTGAAAAVAVFALSAYGRVPTMMNFTSGVAGLASALRTAQVKRIVTARRFIDLAKLEAVIEGLGDHEIVYLEDVRAHLTLGSKLRAVIGRLMPGLIAVHSDFTRTAVILFTSGTEGEPKGVALSHENVLANVAQVRAHIDLYPGDVLFNPLPVFHCFGLTVGIMLPLIAGVKVVCHPTPLQPKEIVRRIRRHGATIMLATDTFISQLCPLRRAGRPRHHAAGGVRRRAAARRDPHLCAQEIRHRIAGRLRRHRSLAGGRRQPARSQSSRHGRTADGGDGGAAGAGGRHPQCRTIGGQGPQL